MRFFFANADFTPEDVQPLGTQPDAYVDFESGGRVTKRKTAHLIGKVVEVRGEEVVAVEVNSELVELPDFSGAQVLRTRA